MDFVIMQKENDAVILRGLNTGNMYLAAKFQDGWYMTKKKISGQDWISFPRTRIEPDVTTALGLEAR